MRDHHDEFLLRRDDDELALAEQDRAADLPSEGGPRRACVTLSLGAYPTRAGSFYAVVDRTILGTEAEGQGSTEESAGEPFFAYNLGSKVPPVGTKIEVSHVPYRWVFTFGAPSPISVEPPPTPPGEPPVTPPVTVTPETGYGTGAVVPFPPGAKGITGALQGLESSLAFGQGSVAVVNPTVAFGQGRVISVPAGTIAVIESEAFASTLAFGEGSIAVGPVTVTGTGRSSSLAFGTGTVSAPPPTQTLTGTGLASSLAFGSGEVKIPQVLGGTGIASTLAFGSGSVITTQTITGSGLASGLAFGEGYVANADDTQVINGTGLGSTLAFGTGTVSTGPPIIPPIDP